MSNKIETVSIGDLPIATELDDADELLLRDSSAALPENATARLSIATLRAAMGGSPDRIESPSGEASVEATDSFRGLGTPASQSEAIARGAGASSGAYTLPKGADKAVAEAALFAGTAAMTNGASIKARYDSETGERRLVAEGAPLEVPTPTAPNHAATKGYVDARPGAEKWSEHAATQDVDLDGHKITGLGEPTDAADAATKGYVDGAAPDRIKGGAGTTYEETEIGVGPDATGIFSALLSGKNRGDEFLRLLARENSSGTGWLGWYNTKSGYGRGYVRWSSSNAELYGQHSAGNFGRVYLDGISGGNVYFDIPGANAGGGHASTKGILLGTHSGHTPNVRALPSNVNSILHGIKLGVDAHDRRAELEWWEPVWTPVNNVDSVSNVECSYTRTYRAAGGSLVTLEGTIEVTPDAADTMTMVSVDLPVPRDGVDIVAGIGSFTDYDGDDFGLARAGVADLGAGQQVSVQYTPSTDAVHRVSFRVSYRAA